VLNFKMGIASKEEAVIKEQLEDLEIEKLEY
jgi:hypothetical protein